MGLKVIELNDRAVRVGGEDGLVLESPGFALADGGAPALGEAAERQARLKPAQSWNRYWHELGLDPIAGGGSFRHFADIAHAHLLHLAEAGGVDGEVILAVPGSFSRAQLALLLGIAAQCPFKVVGMADAAVAASAAAARAETVVHAELQLHQAALTSMRLAGGRLRAEGFAAVPDAGGQRLMETAMKAAADMFVRQCRFDPRHNAESEQRLYDAMPGWLERARRDDGDPALELEAGGGTHAARLSRTGLLRSLAGLRRRIAERIESMAPGQVILGPALAALPGFAEALSGLRAETAEPEAVCAACMAHRGLIAAASAGEDAGLRLVDELPAAARPAPAPAEPTHALCGDRAVALGERLAVESREEGAPAGALRLSAAVRPESLGRIERGADGVYFDGADGEYLLNAASARGRRRLRLGDRLRLSPDGEDIRLIRVCDGR